MAKFTVLGMGGFGISLAVMLDKYGHDITVWTAFQSEIDDILRDGENKQKLPGVKVKESIKLTTDINVVSECDVVLIGIPTGFVRSIAKQIAPLVKSETIILNTSKGLEKQTHKRMSEVLSEELPNSPIVIMTGPSHAEEVGMGVPTTIVVASKEFEHADYVQSILSNSCFRVYINDDIIGCEVGGSLKNIIALCAGICDGMGYGDNTKAALMTRGIAEIARLGVAMGAKIETFAGLTGIGDLIVTCTSMHSRNRRAGMLIGEGLTPAEAVERIGTVEGYLCTFAAYELAEQLGVELPITEQCYNVLTNKIKPEDGIKNLMARPKRHETEQIWVN